MQKRISNRALKLTQFQLGALHIHRRLHIIFHNYENFNFLYTYFSPLCSFQVLMGIYYPLFLLLKLIQLGLCKILQTLFLHKHT
ncbi:hypothetical protein XELAEV_18015313mg [Xenopus laevis]|uniref:Uncharacterized protein n=1 Tax=Xenopus laevis TaxID=8355 RepID=A0A974DHQ5_XENLA|nr:hypothetical protein XELAEV_18015313mg [Xenopus laevis]